MIEYLIIDWLNIFVYMVALYFYFFIYFKSGFPWLNELTGPSSPLMKQYMSLCQLHVLIFHLTKNNNNTYLTNNSWYQTCLKMSLVLIFILNNFYSSFGFLYVLVGLFTHYLSTIHLTVVLLISVLQNKV